MRGFRREQVETQRDLQTNLGIIEDHVNDNTYLWRLGPQDFGYHAGTAVSRIGANLLHTAVSFPAAVLSQTYAEKHRPAYWISGNLRTTVYYTGDTASTNNIRFSGRLSAVASGGNLDAAGTAFTAVLSPGPTAAGDEKSFTFTDIYPIDASHRHIAVKITRLGNDATDTYAGDCLVTQVVIEFVPTGQQL